MNGKWKSHGSKDVYENEWMTVSIVDVEFPDGARHDYHVMSTPNASGSAMLLAHVPDKGVLVIWRHRFITDTWGWELPAGRIDGNEKPEVAAAREMLEETAWEAGKVTKLLSYRPMGGLTDHMFHSFTTSEATWKGPAPDGNEAADIAWVSIPELRTIIEKGEMTDGYSLNTVLYAMQFGSLK